MKYACIIFVAAAYAWLVLWQLLFPHIGCWGALLFIIPVITLITTSMLESAIMHRRAKVGTYLQSKGWLYRILRGGIVMVLWQTAKGLFLALFLMLDAIFWERWLWMVLAADIFAVFLIYILIARIINTHVKAEYLTHFSLDTMIWINSIVLTIIIGITQMYMPHTNYQELSWMQAVDYEVARVQTRCEVTMLLAQASTVKNTVILWLAEHLLTKIANPSIAYGAWLLFFGNSAIFVWGYSRMLAGALGASLKAFTPTKDEPS